MGWRRWGIGGVLAAVYAAAAAAAPPEIGAAESSVRLGVSAGYAGLAGDASRYAAAGGIYGLDASVGELTPNRILSWGAPDFYADVSEALQAAPDGRAGPSNTTIVRLGLGWPIFGAAEFIPYVAGGYQSLSDKSRSAGLPWHEDAGLFGGGLKLAMTTGPFLVVSASAEGFATLGDGEAVPSQNFDAAPGAGTEERVSLDADYRLSAAWHAFAGLGFTHYASGSARPGEWAPAGGGLVQVNSMFGVAYGF